MKSDDSALGSILQADGERKLRPILLLCQLPGFGDWLTVGISSQIRQAIKNWDVLIDPGLAKYSSTGLVKVSIVRLSFLGVAPRSVITGLLGELPDADLRLIKDRLSKFFSEK